MNKQEAQTLISKFKSKYFDCSTPKCGENGLCWDCNKLKPLIDLFGYFEDLEKKLESSDALDVSNQTIDMLKEKIFVLQTEAKGLRKIRDEYNDFQDKLKRALLILDIEV